MQLQMNEKMPVNNSAEIGMDLIMRAVLNNYVIDWAFIYGLRRLMIGYLDG